MSGTDGFNWLAPFTKRAAGPYQRPLLAPGPVDLASLGLPPRAAAPPVRPAAVPAPAVAKPEPAPAPSRRPRMLLGG
jgi:hypothetical protein